MNSVKRCTRCGLTKLIDAFPQQKGRPLGVAAHCKQCRSAWYYLNHERNLEVRRRWKAENREAHRASSRQWVLQNPDQDRAWRRMDYAKRPEFYAAKGKAWREANPERIREIQQRANRKALPKKLAWERNHPEVKKASSQRRRARKAAASVVPFTSRQLAERLSMFAGCWMCGGPKEHVDHVKPLAHNGPHILANLRPACRRCNQSKGARWKGVLTCQPK